MRADAGTMMRTKAVSVEFFFAAGCAHCATTRDALREVAESAADVEWNEIDIGKHPNRAVDAGVMSTPAVAIDGSLVFTCVPTPSELLTAIHARIAKG